MRYLATCISLWIIVSACNQTRDAKKAIGNPLSILESTNTFWAYQYQHVHFYEDFTPLDVTLKPISKDTFFKSLRTGNYLPLKLYGPDSLVSYQLYPLNNAVTADLRNRIKYWALEKYANYQSEGIQVPAYRFVDASGKEHTSESDKGKIVVLKCWFVRCTPCIQEMPALNELKNQYKNRSDIVFISLCTDSQTEMEALLKKNPFEFANVADQEKYVTHDLQVNAYPTLFVIDKSGKIKNKTTDYHEMAYVLQKESSGK